VGIRLAGMSDTGRFNKHSEQVKQQTLLKRLPAVDDTAKIAAFLAYDRANTITGAIINATCGRVID